MNVWKNISQKWRAFRCLGLREAVRYKQHNAISDRWQGAVGETYTLKPTKCAHPLTIRYGTSDRGVFEQIFIEQEYAPLRLHGDVKLIIDCGANVGYASAYFLSIFPHSHVIAVEPDPNNFAALERNLAPYGERVTLVRSGVWSHATGLVVCQAGLDDGWRTQVRACAPGEAPDLTATDIPALIALSGRERIDLLKVDIEGAETVLFGPASRHWLGKVKNIVAELHGPECEAALSHALAGADYRRSTSGELTLCEGIVFPPAPA